MSKILLVDDNREIVDLLATILGLAGHETRKAYSGSDALGALAEDAFDLVLLDLMMPVIDGFGVLEAMRDNRRLSETPVLVITASAESNVEAQVLAAGAQACLFKPIKLDRLERMVLSLLAKRARSGLEKDLQNT